MQRALKKRIAFILSVHALFLACMIWPPSAKVHGKKRLVVRTIYPRELKTWELDKEAPRFFCPERGTVFENTARVQDEKSVAPPSTPPPRPAQKRSTSSASPIKRTPSRPPKKHVQNAKPRARFSESTQRELARRFALLERSSAQPQESLESALLALLQRTLRLPDFGEVKVQLTLHSDGSVAKVIVLEAESEKNRAYLEAHLPHLHFKEILGQRKSREDITVVIAFYTQGG